MTSIVGPVAQEQGGLLTPSLNLSVLDNSSLRDLEETAGGNGKHQKKGFRCNSGSLLSMSWFLVVYL